MIILIADTVSDILHYFFWYYWGIKFINKYGHYINISTEKVVAISLQINKNKVKTIMSKMIYGIWGIPIIACGLAKIPIWQFLCISIPVSCLQIIIYITLWYYFWEFYDNFLKYLDYWWYIFVILALVILWIYIYLNKKK